MLHGNLKLEIQIKSTGLGFKKVNVIGLENGK